MGKTVVLYLTNVPGTTAATEVAEYVQETFGDTIVEVSAYPPSEDV